MAEAKPSKSEEAALAAEVSAAHAEKAAEQAESDELVAARALAAEHGSKACPHCHGVLVQHSAAKDNAWHCNTCGACWAPGLRELRAGHPAPVGWPH